MPEEVHHVELRQFPHNLCRFNLSEGELRATLLAPWVGDRVFELGERSWDPRRAKLTVLRGPRLAPGELTMGRGWRAAQRRGREVTAEVLADARASGAAATSRAKAGVEAGDGGGGEAPAEAAVAEAEATATPAAAADSFALELLAAIGSQRVPLRRVWALAEERCGGGAASVSLALAERAVASLLRSGLVVLLRGEAGAEGSGELGRDEVGAVLAASSSWSGDAVAVRRA